PLLERVPRPVADVAGLTDRAGCAGEDPSNCGMAKRGMPVDQHRVAPVSQWDRSNRVVGLATIDDLSLSDRPDDVARHRQLLGLLVKVLPARGKRFPGPFTSAKKQPHQVR